MFLVLMMDRQSGLPRVRGVRSVSIKAHEPHKPEGRASKGNAELGLLTHPWVASIPLVGSGDTRVFTNDIKRYIVLVLLIGAVHCAASAISQQDVLDSYAISGRVVGS